MLNSRELNPTDFPTISAFAQTAEELFYIAPFADFPWQAKQFAEAIHDRLSNTVFLDGETIIGFANFYDYELGDNAFIGNVIINPEKRRAGYGKQVLQYMLEKGFTEHGFQEIHLSCFSGNTAGLLLYRKLGFKPYGIEQRTDYKNESVALVNFSLTESDYRQTLSDLKLNQITAKLTNI
ncbi:MAG: GNAT family N-acetyltransferase [Gammaproteobacteria bacterium]|nr:GNAT family N-acetyltransferase [Gammaproteobacteria bacterium]